MSIFIIIWRSSHSLFCYVNNVAPFVYRTSHSFSISLSYTVEIFVFLRKKFALDTIWYRAPTDFLWQFVSNVYETDIKLCLRCLWHCYRKKRIPLNHLIYSQTGRRFCVSQICYRYVKTDISVAQYFFGKNMDIFYNVNLYCDSSISPVALWIYHNLSQKLAYT